MTTTNLIRPESNGVVPRTDPAVSPDRTIRPGVVAWRAAIAAAGWFGLVSAIDGDLSANMRYFSEITCLSVALTATLGVIVALTRSTRWDRVVDWARGASTTYAVVTALIFATLLGGDYSHTGSLFMHAIMPALALADWLFFGPTRRYGWRVPLTWLILPVAYLAFYYNVRDITGAPLYPFIDPSAPSFWMWVAIMLGVFAVAAHAIWGLGRLRVQHRQQRPMMTV